MFERYTESARRVLFFARYEVTKTGGTTIETEHLLLGVLREREGVAARILAAQVSRESIRKEIEARTTALEKVPTSVEIPFSVETKRVLELAAEEAARLRHSYIGPEHLLLALLRDEHSVAATILIKHGLRLDDVRASVAKLTAERPAEPRSPVDFHVQLDRVIDVPAEIDRILPWVGELVGMVTDNVEARGLAIDIRDRLEELRRRLAE